MFYKDVQKPAFATAQFSNSVHCASREFEMAALRVYRLRVCVCVCMRLAKFTHFKLFICGAQLNRSRVGRFLACCKCTEQNLHFDCPECKHKELVCVSLCVSQMVCVYVRLCQGGGFEKKRKRDGNRLGSWRLLAGTLAKNSNCAG